MADKHSTQFDAGAFEDWMWEMMTISQSMEFVIGLLMENRQHSHAAQALSIFQKTLADQITKGHEHFVF
jgi:hypothetical protein